MLPRFGQAGYITDGDNKTGWDHAVKIRAYLVGLSKIRDEARKVMVRYIRQWCPDHQSLFTMLGPEYRVEIEVDVWIK